MFHLAVCALWQELLPEVCITLLQGLLLMAWLTDEEPVKIKIGKLMARRFQEVCKWASQIGTFYDPFKYHHSAFIYY